MSKKHFTPEDDGIFDEFYDYEHLPKNMQEMLIAILRASAVEDYKVEDDPIVRGLINSIAIQLAGIYLDDLDDEHILYCNCLDYDKHENVKELMESFKERFHENMHRHPNLIWDAVKRAIESDERVFRAVLNMENKWMENKGYEPDVYYYDEDGFYIGTCVKESCYQTNCKGLLVYDEIIKKQTLDDTNYSTGLYTVKNEARRLGVDIMNAEQYMLLQKNEEFDEGSIPFLKTDFETRLNGEVTLARGFHDIFCWSTVYTHKGVGYRGYNHNDDMHWRGTIWVKWADNEPGFKDESLFKEELPPEQKEKLLKILEIRFKTYPERHKDIDWADVEGRLKEANPRKLWSLNEMERTSGEPDVVYFDKTTGQYTFFDCSKETPSGRYNLCYDREAQEEFENNEELMEDCGPPAGNAVDMAKSMGLGGILSPYQYMDILQKFGEFDRNSQSWIKTPTCIRKEDKGDEAYYSVSHLQNDIQIRLEYAGYNYEGLGFRGWLKV